MVRIAVLEKLKAGIKLLKAFQALPNLIDTSIEYSAGIPGDTMTVLLLF